MFKGITFRCTKNNEVLWSKSDLLDAIVEVFALVKRIAVMGAEEAAAFRRGTCIHVVWKEHFSGSIYLKSFFHVMVTKGMVVDGKLQYEPAKIPLFMFDVLLLAVPDESMSSTYDEFAAVASGDIDVFPASDNY